MLYEDDHLTREEREQQAMIWAEKVAEYHKPACPPEEMDRMRKLWRMMEERV